MLPLPHLDNQQSQRILMMSGLFGGSRPAEGLTHVDSRFHITASEQQLPQQQTPNTMSSKSYGDASLFGTRPTQQIYPPPTRIYPYPYDGQTPARWDSPGGGDRTAALSAQTDREVKGKEKEMVAGLLGTTSQTELTPKTPSQRVHPLYQVAPPRQVGGLFGNQYTVESRMEILERRLKSLGDGLMMDDMRMGTLEKQTRRLEKEAGERKREHTARIEALEKQLEKQLEERQQTSVAQISARIQALEASMTSMRAEASLCLKIEKSMKQMNADERCMVKTIKASLQEIVTIHQGIRTEIRHMVDLAKNLLSPSNSEASDLDEELFDTLFSEPEYEHCNFK
ncbi:hypothetical protein F4677DRAFT_68590 [Hypoxylon crocopeplum]|nr:hypothetical protein F4677DRAFT_68590 [Hypoxylon crocopeplum]